MASVTLVRLWVNVAADPEEYRALRLADINVEDPVPVEVRTYAGGRERAVRRKTRGRLSYTATVRRPSQADVQWLRAHTGETVVVRDPRGHKFFGVYAVTGYAFMPGLESAEDLRLSVQQITQSEAVI